MVSRIYLYQGLTPSSKLRRRTKVDCFLVDLFWALQILYQASFRFSPSLCLKFKTSLSGDNGEDKRLAMMTSKQTSIRANKKANGKERRRLGKRGQIKQQGWSGGEENERQMANNVMREIGIAMGTWYGWLACVNLPGNGTRNSSCYVLSTALDFPEEERMMQQSSVSISLSFWEPRYQSSRRPRTSPSYLHKTIATRNQRD